MKKVLKEFVNNKGCRHMRLSSPNDFKNETGTNDAEDILRSLK